jgi:hypothetical protein
MALPLLVVLQTLVAAVEVLEALLMVVVQVVLAL